MQHFRVWSINWNDTMSCLTAYMTYRQCKRWIRNRGNHSFFVISSIDNAEKINRKYLKG